MSAERTKVLNEWRTGCKHIGIDPKVHRTPAYATDLVQEFEYARASMIPELVSDTDIAANVRAVWWLFDMMRKWLPVQ